VELYNNENDQVDALKRFFAENGKALAVGVILGRWRAGWLALLDLPSAGYRQRLVSGL
jgi:predicted negative regulator of RcsB-dependent stress response